MAAAKTKAVKWYDKLPKRVWVSSYDFSVHAVDASDPMLDGHDAMTSFHGNTIHLSRGMSPARLLNRVLHEVTHCINNTAGIADGAGEEDIATHHGDMWAAIWVSNPKLLQFVVDITNTVRVEALRGA